MKYLSIAILLSIFACSNPKTTIMKTEDSSSKAPLVGGDRDEHGCIPSAGYQYSELKNDCIRPFELALQLQNKDNSFMAGVIIADDASKAEVFAKEGHFVMLKDKNNNYQLNDWALVKENGKWQLFHVNDGNNTYFEK